MINRRGLCSLLLASGLVRSTRAQTRPKLIGLLVPWDREDAKTKSAGLVAALRELGYVSGRHFEIVVRTAEGRSERLPGLAQELVQLNVDLLIVVSTDAAKAAREATRTIPIVFFSVADPVGSGFADTLARPGHNMTGVSNAATSLESKRLDLVKQMVPGLERVAFLLNPTSPFYPSTAADYRALAGRFGLRALMVNASTAEEFEPAFREMVTLRAQALIVMGDVFFSDVAESIATLAIRHHLPSMWGFGWCAELGGLMAYGATHDGIARQVALCVDKIFRGARPEGIPIAEPTSFDFVINKKTANLLRIKIPSEVLLQATSVVE